MDAEKYIETLKGEQAQLARQSLLSPKGRDAFELGLICGMVQAYERMLALVEEQLNDKGDEQPQSQRPARKGNPYLTELDQASTLPEQFRRR